MAQLRFWGKLDALAAHPELVRVVVHHAYLGIRAQFLLRGVLAVFLLLTVALAPPLRERTASWVITVAYLLWVAATAMAVRRGTERLVRVVWVLLYMDVVVLGVLTLLAGNSAVESWTADILTVGFFALPVMAAAQLRPWVCVSTCAPALAVYVLSGIATRLANDEPWASLWLRSWVFLGVCAGSVLLTRVQQSRVLTIGSLVEQRRDLLRQLVQLEEDERRDLAEQLHDGALQYVLAARRDAEDARDYADPGSFDRLQEGLAQASGLLRSTVTTLHPAVLEQAGLARAVQSLAADQGGRGRAVAQVDVSGWPEGLATTADPLLYATIRELLANVRKHAQASHVVVTLAWEGGVARASVVDDGVGVDESTLKARRAEGHIGLAAREARLQAAGGTLRLSAASPHGTRAELEVPAAPV